MLPSDLLGLVGIAPGEITPEREFVIELGRTFHLLMRFIGETLEVIGITPQQYAILEILSRHAGGMGQDSLRAIMLCSRPNLSGLVERMVKSGLIASRGISTDRRRRVLTVTTRGASTLHRARPVYRRALQELFAPVALRNKKLLVQLIREVRHPLEAASAESRKAHKGRLEPGGECGA